MQDGAELTAEEYVEAMEEISTLGDDETDAAWEAAGGRSYFWQPLTGDEEQRMYSLETSESWSEEDVAFAGEIAVTMLQRATGYYDAYVSITDEYFDKVSSLAPPEHLTALHDSFIATGREAVQFWQTQVDAVRGANAEVNSGEELAEFLALVNLQSGQPDPELLWEKTAQNSAACLALKEQLEAELERDVSICGASGSSSAETDREALIALYNATGGPNWTNNENWLSDTPVGEWHGVVSDSAGGVISLALRSNGLRGEIPGELGQISYLLSLDLADNELSGEIPPELGQLSNLEILYLYRNNLTGQIPGELGQLSILTSLALWDNALSGEIPPELGQLSKLTSLDLWGNALSGEIPPELGQLSNLTYLALWQNALSGEIPPELGRLSNLENLDLSSNNLSGEIPPELGQLSNLTRLALWRNALSGEVPPELGNLSKLEDLRLADNDLIFCLPEALRNVDASVDLPFCRAASSPTAELTTEEYAAAMEEISTFGDDEIEAAFGDFLFNGIVTQDEAERIGSLKASDSWSDDDTAFISQYAENLLQTVTGLYDFLASVLNEILDRMSRLRPPDHLSDPHDNYITTNREFVQFLQTHIETVKKADTEVKSREELAALQAIINSLEMEPGQLDPALEQEVEEIRARVGAACLGLKGPIETELGRSVNFC
ncbi:MAG: hypothetical protein OXC99_02655 [Chloroflexi bacterium]|nr:hypothetical protein [Chloroflexota bacterium]